MKDGLIEVKNENGKLLVSARDLYGALLSNQGKKERFSQWFKRHLQYGFDENVDYAVTKKFYIANQHGAIGKLDDYEMTLDMAKDICRKQRRNTIAPKVLQYLLTLEDKEVYIVEPQRKEIEFLDALEQQLSYIFGLTKFKRQYSDLKCGNYRVDLYIEEFNVAIEYDENGHKGYTYEQQGLRQQLIENELGCKFIRVCDDKSHVENSAIVIKSLLDMGFYSK